MTPPLPPKARLAGLDEAEGTSSAAESSSFPRSAEQAAGAPPARAVRFAHAPPTRRAPERGPSLHSVPTFREIYDQYFNFVWRCAANRGVPAAALDDVTQEVFIVVDRKLGEFEGRSSLRTWIAAIVRRVVADYLKKRGNQPAADESLEREPTSAANPQSGERRAALELLDELLAKMPDEQREVFVLHEIEELSGAEIAEITDTNENTVWTRLRAARRIFQEGVARQRARHAREES